MDVDSPPRGEPAGRRAGLGHRVTSAITASFAVFVVARLLQVGFLAALARLLSPADFGVAAAAAAFLSIVTLVAQMGVGTAIVQSPVLTDRTINVANTIILAMAVLVFGLMEIGAPLVATWFRNDLMTPVVRVVALAGLGFAVAAVPQGLLTRDLRARDLALIDLAAAAAGTGLVAIPLAIIGWGYWALITGLIVQAFTRAVLVGSPPGGRSPSSSTAARSAGCGPGARGFPWWCCSPGSPPRLIVLLSGAISLSRRWGSIRAPTA